MKKYLKTFKLKNLDCANCAAKMENQIKKIAEIQNVSINFMTQKMKIETATNIDENMIRKIEKAIQYIDADVSIEKRS